jgi:hypothetical protein
MIKEDLQVNVIKRSEKEIIYKIGDFQINFENDYEIFHFPKKEKKEKIDFFNLFYIDERTLNKKKTSKRKIKKEVHNKKVELNIDKYLDQFILENKEFVMNLMNKIEMCKNKIDE